MVSEAQRLGALAVLLISLTVYGVSLLDNRRPVRETPLPWGNQGQGLVAVEVAGDPGRDGIYFLPAGMTVEKVLYLTRIPGMNRPGKSDRLGISAGSVLTASPLGEVDVGEMAAARKLALGLYGTGRIPGPCGAHGAVRDQGKKTERPQRVPDGKAGALTGTGSDLKSVPTVQGAALFLLYPSK
jgi:hypothetical protein